MSAPPGALGGIALSVNGEPLDVPEGATVSAVLDRIASPQRGVAVALNGEVVPRSAWQETVLSGGDRLEVLTASQGG